MFPAIINLSDLASGSGSIGFVLNGADSDDGSGFSVSGAGDINGDGINDLLVGAYKASRDGFSGTGESYVVLGRDSGFDASLDLASLANGDGSRGFVLYPAADSVQSSWSVSAAGDINNDGLDDLIIGAPFSGPDFVFRAGRSDIVFGANGEFGPTIEMSRLSDDAGFTVFGSYRLDASGVSVAGAGDVNGDDINDLLISAPLGDTNNTYVVFGREATSTRSLYLSDIADSNGSLGFVLNGIAGSGQGAESVSGAGDINGDGINDLIIGEPFADPGGRSNAGETYVVFGRTNGFDAEFNLLNLRSGDGSTGFVLNGANSTDQSGTSVAGVGDVNGDGLDDFIVGAPFAGYNGDVGAGRSYVVFGRGSGYGGEFELSSLAEGDGSAGFVLNGASLDDGSGFSVSGAGDVNGDGIADIVIGAPHASGVGETYVVFGRKTGFSSVFELSDLTSGDGSAGFVVKGIENGDGSGWSVSGAGDVNGDGFDDIIIGAPSANAGDRLDAGQSYVIFGRGTPTPTIAARDDGLAEGDTGSTSFVFEVARTGDLDQTVSYEWVVSGDVDVADFDGNLLPSGTVFLGPGESTTTITILVAGDTEFEPNEDFSVALSDFSDVSAFSVILNDDAPATSNVPPTATPIDAGTVAEDAAAVSIDLLADASASDSDGGTLGVANVTATDQDGSTIVFELNGATLSIDPSQFADGLNLGETATIAVAYEVTDGQGGVTPNTATLVIDGLDGPFTWYRDQDDDGFGVDDPGAKQLAYKQPAGTAAVSGDADDTDASVFPGAPEVNDGKDNDQDGETDEDNNPPLADPETFEVDQDNTLVVSVAILLEGDFDADGDTLTVAEVSDAMNGTAELDDKGDSDPTNDDVIFTPTPGYSGPASFGYTVTDGFGGEDTQTVGVVVNEVTTTTAETRVFPDGRILVTEFIDGTRSVGTMTDVLDARAWSSFVDRFDDEGELISRKMIFDDGRIKETVYVSGAKATETLTDVNNVRAWTTYSDTFDINGSRVERLISYDDGRVATSNYSEGKRIGTETVDTADTFVWASIEQEFDQNGQRSSRTTLYDDGRVLETSYTNGVRSFSVVEDVADVKPWKSIVNTFDSEGDRVSRIIEFDDGSEIARSYSEDIEIA